MRKLIYCYRIANVLSVDVAVGAVISALFFSRVYKVYVLPYGFAALGLSVWIIYSVDHLLDARKLSKEASTDRHRFHQKFFAPVAVAVGLACVIDLIVISHIRRTVLIHGAVLALVSLAYLMSQHYLKSFKEISGALLYCAGVALPAISLLGYPLKLFQGLFLVEFGITALCNLLLFSLFDFKNDLRDRRHSFATVMGPKRTGVFLGALFCVNVTLIIVGSIWTGQVLGSVIMFVMNLVLMTLFLLRRNLSSGVQYRYVGDAVFFIPLFILLPNL